MKSNETPIIHEMNEYSRGKSVVQETGATQRYSPLKFNVCKLAFTRNASAMA